MSSESIERRGWLEVAEAGTLAGLKFMVVLCTLFGRGAARAFLFLLTLYFAASRPDLRRTARAYRRRMGIPAGFWNIHRQVWCFAEVATDRFFLIRNQFHRFAITQNGHEHMVKLREEKRGAILLGAHLGSFEAMRMRSDAERVPVNVVGYFKNTARINNLLAKFNPNLNTRFIEVDPDAPGFIFAIKECIERGELVAILGDRAGHGAKTVASFLGSPAEFPTGPYVLASVLECPIYLTFGLYTQPNHYDLYCEPFAENLKLPRKGRDEALQALAQRYAERLEHYARMAPDCWFNFYDFWLDDVAERKRTTKPPVG
jgi:predicted LPLAT superfamily acyltransferase